MAALGDSDVGLVLSIATGCCHFNDSGWCLDHLVLDYQKLQELLEKANAKVKGLARAGLMLPACRPPSRSSLIPRPAVIHPAPLALVEILFPAAGAEQPLVMTAK